MWQYQKTDELYHYGVLGMKWGQRKDASINKAYDNYNRATSLYKAEAKNLKRRGFKLLAGSKNVAHDKKVSKDLNRAYNRQQQAGYKVVDTMAKAAYDKKLKKTNDKAKAEKASIKVHAKAMAKGGHGLVGSVADQQSGNQQTKYFNHLVKTKGQKYAETVEKKHRNKLLASAGVVTAAATGAYIYSMYSLYKY